MLGKPCGDRVKVMAAVLRSWKLLTGALHIGGLGVMVACLLNEQEHHMAAVEVSRQPYLGNVLPALTRETP